MLFPEFRLFPPVCPQNASSRACSDACICRRLIHQGQFCVWELRSVRAASIHGLFFPTCPYEYWKWVDAEELTWPEARAGAGTQTRFTIKIQSRKHTSSQMGVLYWRASFVRTLWALLRVKEKMVAAKWSNTWITIIKTGNYRPKSCWVWKILSRIYYVVILQWEDFHEKILGNFKTISQNKRKWLFWVDLFLFPNIISFLIDTIRLAFLSSMVLFYVLISGAGWYLMWNLKLALSTNVFLKNNNYCLHTSAFFPYWHFRGLYPGAWSIFGPSRDVWPPIIVF